MYIWRHWRETLFGFFACLIFSLMVAGPFSAKAPGHARTAIEESWLLLGVPAGLLAGLLIGSRSIGTEIRAGSGDFLLTRPRSRKYFIWTGWALGVIEIVVILAATACYMGSLLYHRNGPFWRSLPASEVDISVLLASATVFALLVYSVSYLASVLTRRSSVAIGITLGFCFGYQVVVNRFGWAHAHLPDMLVVPYKPLHGEYSRATAVHQLIPWVIVALILPLLAQVFFESTEI